MKHFERELPEGYEEALVVDAKSKKLSVILTLVSLLVTAAVAVIAYLIVKPNFVQTSSPLKFLLFAGVTLAYIVAHELVHGIAYKAFTREKLTFGMTLTVAFCGVPKIYVYRKAALCALLAPFVTFTLVFLGLAIGISDPLLKFLFWVTFGLHVGGCSGDLYGTYLYLFKFKDPETLMQDTGPKQTFYVKSK